MYLLLNYERKKCVFNLPVINLMCIASKTDHVKYMNANCYDI